METMTRRQLIYAVGLCDGLHDTYYKTELMETRTRR